MFKFVCHSRTIKYNNPDKIVFYVKCYASGIYISKWKKTVFNSFKYFSSLFHFFLISGSFFLIFGLKIRDTIGLHCNMLLRES